MISVNRIATADDYRIGSGLIDAMAAWDAAESAKLGFSAEAVLQLIYGHTPEKLMTDYSEPGAGFFIGYLDGEAVSCIAFSTEDDIAEIQRVFVSPDARGHGLGKTMLAVVLEDVRQLGCRKVRLETVTFMTEAIALYQRNGFQFCEPFAPVLAGLEEITLFMEREL